MAPRGLRLPIDYFFRALASDRGERSIGVILSGMGSDGTLGLGAIKEQGGAVFVQEPASAKFSAMPQSVIDAGLADVVAPVEELPAKIVGYLSHVPQSVSPEPVLTKKMEGALEKAYLLLRSKTGHDFSQYKRSTVYRRIERRMGLHQIDTKAGYVRYLQENPHETVLLFKELLIGVTSFFRDPAVWAHLGEKALPELLSHKYAEGVLRAWVPGCSTGEEAYSLAIVFKEALARLEQARNLSLQIFATDLDPDAIERARRGSYPPNIAVDVSEERLSRFFVKEEQGFRVSQEIRESVIFATQNLIMDPPFTKLDIVSCRNLLIYLEPELHRKLIPLFHYGLNPGGLLLLGSAETIGSDTALFSPLGRKTRVFRRVEAPLQSERVDFPTAFRAPLLAVAVRAASTTPGPNLQSLVERRLLEHYAPAAVLTNAEGDILYISGRTGRYLEPAAGKANWNLHAMARKGLRYKLGQAFKKALGEQRAVHQPGVALKSGGKLQALDLTIEPLQEPAALRGLVMVVFAKGAAPRALPPGGGEPASSGEEARLERGLLQAREELQTTREEMQASQEELRSANEELQSTNEELQSTNEELQSTNEELQSTNEELTTSKEEMQSMNEELQTLNHELQAKIDELSRTYDDMRNLLDSTDIATLFLDNTLKVRRFTPQMKKIIKLIPGDVDRPITDLASDLLYPKLAEDAREVLKTLVFKETSVATVDSRWFSVRIMPYRTVNNRIDGLVLTFTNITAAKKLEAALRKDGAEKGGRG